MFLNPGAAETAGRCLLLAGARRTGTSLMANLLYSTEPVELSFEPPALRALFPLLGQIPDAQWRYLFDAYLFEDFLVGALAGRRLNFNRNDDSSVYSALDGAEIDRRLAKGHRQVELVPAATNRWATFKLPDVNPYLADFRRVAPDHTVLVMLRNPNSILHSLLRMEWLTDQRLGGVSADWPHRRIHPVPAPHWIEDAYLDDWTGWSPLDRCCYYYCRMYEPVVEIPDVHVISFDAFVADAERQFTSLIDGLGLVPGARTRALLDSIHNPDRKYTTPVEGIPTVWRTRIADAHQACLEKSRIG